MMPMKSNCRTHLHNEDEGGEDGAAEHVVVLGGLPQRGQVMQEVGAEGADRHAHALNHVRKHVQHG